MNIYEVETIEREIERIALDNDGEIPEELFQELVEAQTKTDVTVEKMCRYVRHLQQTQEKADEEIKRIENIKRIASNRETDIKRFMLPYIKMNKPKKRTLEIGLFKLPVRMSKKVIIEEGFKNNDYGRTETKTTFIPDRKKIKAALESGEVIPGAELVEIDNVQVKL